MFLTFISISCTFAEDNNGTNVVSTDNEQADSFHESNTVITIDDINEAKVNHEIDISGKLSDENGIPISDSDVNISLSGMAYGYDNYVPITSEFIKTDVDGIYSYSFMPKTGGQLNITVTYDNKESTSKSIFVAPKSTIITLDNIENISLDDDITLKGRLTDCDGNVLRDTGVGVLITGIGYGDTEKIQYVKEYTRTDNDGLYSYMYKPSTAGSIDICVYFPGYNSYRFNQTLLSKYIKPYETVIEVDFIYDILSNENISISGKLTTKDGNPLRYSYVGIINNEGEKIYSRTNSDGYFNYTYPASTIGTNIVQVYYPGFHNYRFSIENVIFNVRSYFVGELFLTGISDNTDDLYLDLYGKYNFYDNYKAYETYQTIYGSYVKLYTANGVELPSSSFKDHTYKVQIKKSLLTNGTNIVYPNPEQILIEYFNEESYLEIIAFKCSDVAYLEVERIGNNIKIIDYTISKENN